MKFTMNRNFTLVSTAGHSIKFVKGEAVYVPKECRREAIGAGATADAEVAMEDKQPPALDLSEDDRAEMLKMALIDMKARNDRDDFTAAGSPKVKSVEKMTGFETSAAEIGELWSGLNQTGE